MCQHEPVRDPSRNNQPVRLQDNGLCMAYHTVCTFLCEKCKCVYYVTVDRRDEVKVDYGPNADLDKEPA